MRKDRFASMSTDELKEKLKALQLTIEILLGIFISLALLIVVLIFLDIQFLMYFFIPPALIPVILFNRTHVKEIQYELDKRR